nr:MAG: RNA-dependent RNA polymerase [Riboviria sp.]
MKSLSRLAYALLLDCGKQCDITTTRDWKTVARRVELEGESFLTITLPAFAKDFDRSLSLGAVADDAFAGFSRTRGLPRFLGGFLRQVFSSGSGMLLDTPSYDAIRAVRQFTMAFGKLKEGTTPEREADAFAAYVKCDNEVRSHVVPSLARSEFRDHAKWLYSDIFNEVEQVVNQYELVPKHGSGAVQEGIHGNEKYKLMSWHERLQAYFPWDRYLISSPRWASEVEDTVTVLPPELEPPLKVISVPKTKKTPRIIAEEPTAMQYMQQSLMRELVPRLERKFRGSIGFTSQLRNQEYARKGSIDGSYATLDLSEASDRVSLCAVEDLLSSNRTVRGAILACRSSHAHVPGYAPFELAKFASMGSALCFPIEAMVFFTILSISAAQSYNLPRGHRLTAVLREVTVYGDDIIVPAQMADKVRSNLELFGLKVNVTKSFTVGNFRESCGGDYFRGQDVTPYRIRSRPFADSADATRLPGLVALHNFAFERGHENVVSFLVQGIRREMKPLFAPAGVDVCALWSYDDSLPIYRVNPRLQRREVAVWQESSVIPRSPLDGPSALMKFHLARLVSSHPGGEDAFERCGRPRTVRTIRGWSAVT